MGSSNYGIPETPLLRGGSSLFSLTFDEFQNVLGEPGVHLESMNMEELLKNIWTAEESQAMVAAIEGLNGGLASQFSLQKQASLSLPRTLSGRTVEDVWKTLQHQQVGAQAVPSSMNHHQRKATLGEITLEDFFMKAGIVRERPPMSQVASNQVPNSRVISPLKQVLESPSMQNLVPPNQVDHVPKAGTSISSNHMHEASLAPSNQGHPLMQQQALSNQALAGFGGNSVFSVAKDDQNGKHQAGAMASNKNISMANTFRCPPPSDRTDWINNPHGQHFLTFQSQQGQQQLMQPQANVETTSNLGNVPNGGNRALTEASAGRLSPIDRGLGAVLGTGGLGMGFGANPASTRISFGAGSPLSPAFDEGSPGTSNLPLAFMTTFGNGGQQRRKRCAEAPVEKVIERRQRRMIKNRESAARSRARKQAYTVELEAEVSQLKEENMKLLQKQEEEAARRKKQVAQIGCHLSASQGKCNGWGCSNKDLSSKTNCSAGMRECFSN